MEQPADFPRVDPDTLRRLGAFPVASVNSALTRMGFKNTYMAGLVPLTANVRMCGQAVTLRYLPLREDLVETPRIARLGPAIRAIEMLQPGDVLVIDAGGCLEAATLGDMMTTGIALRGGAGLVVDGAMRDLPALRGMSLPVFARGLHAAGSPRRLMPYDVNLAVQCGGVTVLPGDVILSDEEGVLAIPCGRAAEAAALTEEIEALETFIRRRMEAGLPLSQAYPPTEEMRRAFEEERHRGEA